MAIVEPPSAANCSGEMVALLGADGADGVGVGAGATLSPDGACVGCDGAVISQQSPRELPPKMRWNKQPQSAKALELDEAAITAPATTPNRRDRFANIVSPPRSARCQLAY